MTAPAPSANGNGIGALIGMALVGLFWWQVVQPACDAVEESFDSYDRRQRVERARRAAEASDLRKERAAADCNALYAAKQSAWDVHYDSRINRRSNMHDTEMYYDRVRGEYQRLCR